MVGVLCWFHVVRSAWFGQFSKGYGAAYVPSSLARHVIRIQAGTWRSRYYSV